MVWVWLVRLFRQGGMMFATSWEPLPFVVATIVLLLAAASQVASERVPNVLTLPAILAGWGFAFFLDSTQHARFPGQASAASLLGAFLALAIMVPFYRYGLGAACVKTQMAFGAWMGCAIPTVPVLIVVAVTTTLGLALTYASVRALAPNTHDEEFHKHGFPAQVTMTIATLVGVVAYWMVSLQV